MKRLHLRLEKLGTFILSREDDGDSWKREFPSLFQALQFAHSLSPGKDVRLTVTDPQGKEIIETFV